jgi:hypothetical protein
MPAQYRDREPDGLREIPPLSDDEEVGDVESQEGNFHVGHASETSENGGAIPIWLQESAKSFRFRWVPLPLRKAGRATVNWVKGPIPPRELKIRPCFARVQETPIRLMNKYVPKYKHRVCLLMVFNALWFLVWSLMVRHNSTASNIEGFGQPTNLWCGASFWNENNGCGLNGNECRPFSSANMAFRCPANCLATHLLNRHIVGNVSYQYQGLVIGGPRINDPNQPAVYRADSFICQAAIHAGVISNDLGGCGIASLIGEYTGFDSTERNGIKSVEFPSTFPRTFYFPDPSEYDAKCPRDSRWSVFAVTAVALVVLSLFTTSPAAFFFSTYIILMFHVGLVSDPPNKANFYELLSTLFSRLLPASFIAFILYRSSAVPLLSGLTAQVEKTVLYLGFCFLGALNNYTFGPLIPIERLTPHDLSQPGATFALAVIVTIILIIVITQIHWIRISGNMPKYLGIYSAMCLTLLILLALPGQRLRIHHYILAILFMPGTGFKVRPSLAYQGLLLGLFVNGVARWGFASIIQTPAALGEAGGGQGRSWWGSKAPNITALVAPDASNITFQWGGLPPDTGIDGLSILINDVERWRGYTDDELFWDQSKVTLTRQRQFHIHPEPEFYRFAWMNGNSAGRYSRAGVWDENNGWHGVVDGIPPGHHAEME